MGESRSKIVAGGVAAAVLLGALFAEAGEVVRREAQETMTPVELDVGDVLQFTLRNGRTRTLLLEDASAAILERVSPGGIVYHFTCRVQIDGHPMTLERYVCTQESFYEPYVVNGMRIWLDSVADIFERIPIRYPRPGNLDAHPRKRARFAVQDAALRVGPQEMQPWYPNEEGFIDIGDCYDGDDCWMGPYQGEACHVGLDINHPSGDPLWAPIDVDDQFYFNSLAAGHNNNRWRGLRRWPHGDVWAIQTHHLIELFVPEHTAVAAGTKYATTAGVAVGRHEHTHFEFKVANPAWIGAEGEAITLATFDDTAETRPLVYHLDPWILFWQIFEDQRERQGAICAAMEPVGPARTGEPVRFSSTGSRPGPQSDSLRCYWTFGDGGWATGAEVEHRFARPGVYPVTLVVDDGTELATFTQHITVGGEPTASAALVLAAEDEPAFRPRPVQAMDVYGWPVAVVPHTLAVVARPTRPTPASRRIELVNPGGGVLGGAEVSIDYGAGKDWLDVAVAGSGNDQVLSVTVDAAGREPGLFEALVEVAVAGAMNSPQAFRVELRVPERPGAAEVVVDDGDCGFFATPYFWVGHRFYRCPPERRGYGGFYLTNGGRAVAGEFARFTPDLLGGRYRVSLNEATPFPPETAFSARVRHAEGETLVRLSPAESREVGVFTFHEGTDGYVEILAGGSQGLVIADAVDFELVAE